MSGLQRVSFKKGRAHAPRLSPPRVPGRKSIRIWTPAENEILRQWYPKGGLAACSLRLPAHHTSRASIYAQVGKLGIRRNSARGSKKQALVAPKNIDDILRREYENQDGKKRGAINAISDKLKLPRWWVTHRAIKLGLTMPHKKEPPWTAAETALMGKVPLHDLDKCARIFREHGFARSPTAINVRAKRLNISRRFKEGLSGHEAARIVGFDSKTLGTYCIAGDLKASKRADRRSPQQGGSRWVIKAEDLRQFVLDHLGRIDLRKVDKFEFVRLLTTEGSSAGRGRGWMVAEDSILRGGYARGLSLAQIVAELEESGFPHRSHGGISGRARELKISADGRARRWTPAQDRIVRAGYADKNFRIMDIAGKLAAAGCVRSRQSIQMRAIELNLTRDRVNYWSKPEIAIALKGLKAGKTHQAVRAELAAAGFHRGPTALFKFAQKHFVTRKPARWTPQDLAILRARYAARVPVRKIAGELGRKMAAVTSMAHSLGIRQRERWSKRECDLLEEASAGGERLTEAADRIGRPYVAVARMAHLMHLDFSPRRHNGARA